MLSRFWINNIVQTVLDRVDFIKASTICRRGQQRLRLGADSPVQDSVVEESSGSHRPPPPIPSGAEATPDVPWVVLLYHPHWQRGGLVQVLGNHLASPLAQMLWELAGQGVPGAPARPRLRIGMCVWPLRSRR